MTVPALIPQRVAADEKTVIGQFVVGYAVLWLVLTAGAEYKPTADVAVALALTIALTASYLYLPKAVENLGLIKG